MIKSSFGWSEKVWRCLQYVAVKIYVEFRHIAVKLKESYLRRRFSCSLLVISVTIVFFPGRADKPATWLLKRLPDLHCIVLYFAIKTRTSMLSDN